MKRITYVFIALALMLALLPTTVFAHTEDNPMVVDLLAGQTEDIGDVKVWNDGDTLYVQFVYEGPDCGFLEVHLQVDEDEFSSDILTKKGNPIPGQFEASYKPGFCFDEHTFTFDLSDEGFALDDSLVIAAHAALGQEAAMDVDYFADGETAWGCGADNCEDFPGKNWATYFRYTVQGQVEASYPETGNAYIGYEDWGNGDFDYNDFGMYFSSTETYWGTSDELYLTKVTMTFTAIIYDSGMDHKIHIARPIVGGSSYTVTRDILAVSGEGETPAGIYTGSGDVDVVLFNTAKYTWPAKNIGETVTVEIDVDEPALNPKTDLDAPRWDLDPFMANYDPWEVGTLYGSLFHIADMQNVTAMSGGGGRLDARLIGQTLPYILVVPDTDWIPPYEDTCISGPAPYGPYQYFYDYYNSGGTSHPSWYTEITNSTVGWGGLSW
jgi:hypothetical protein